MQERRFFPALSGLCFYGTLLVLLGNCEVIPGCSILGTLLLFVLAGYYASHALTGRVEEAFLTPAGWLSFYLAMLREVYLPFLLACLFFAFLGDPLFADRGSLFDSLLLLRPGAHLWAVQQLVLSLLFFPLLLGLFALIKRGIRKTGRGRGQSADLLLGIAALALTVLAGVWLLRPSAPGLPWYGGERPYAGLAVFLGLALGYLQKAPALQRRISLEALDAAGFLLLAVPPILGFFLPGAGWDQPLPCMLLMGLLPALALWNPGGRYARFLGSLARPGQAALAAYLLHYFLLERFSLTPGRLFVLTAFLTCPASLFVSETLLPGFERMLHSIRRAVIRNRL